MGKKKKKEGRNEKNRRDVEYYVSHIPFLPYSSSSLSLLFFLGFLSIPLLTLFPLIPFPFPSSLIPSPDNTIQVSAIFHPILLLTGSFLILCFVSFLPPSSWFFSKRRIKRGRKTVAKKGTMSYHGL